MGQWQQLCFHDPQDLGDLWLPEDTFLEVEVFLAVVESGRLEVDVVELHPELWWYCLSCWSERFGWTPQVHQKL